MSQLQDTFTTKTEADVFVRTYNQLVAAQSGRIAQAVQTAPGQYQVWLTL